jgi:hypothetical protein
MKIGQIKTDSFGNTLQTIVEIPKKEWDNQHIINKSVSKVYGVMFNDTPIMCAYHKRTKVFDTFIKSCKMIFNLFDTKYFTIKEGDFDEMKLYGYESADGKTGKNIHFTNGVCEFVIPYSNVDSFNTLTEANVDICLVPWHDGVMLQSILVPKDKRNLGIASNIMDMLNRISEQFNIPIYLIPYPGEQFNPKDEFVLEVKLSTWYQTLGYDKAIESTDLIWNKVWCNME